MLHGTIGPVDFQLLNRGGIAETKMHAGITGGREAAAAEHVAALADAAGGKEDESADGVAGSRADGLRAALRAALAADQPFVVDVTIDRSVPSPVVADRIAMLKRQSAGAQA